jgi:hypothetical protein
MHDSSDHVTPASPTIRGAEVHYWSAELMLPGIAGLFLHGAAGIGKSALAMYIADRISSEHPETQITTATGALTVEQLVETLVAERPALVVLDQFDANIVDGTIVNRELAAVLVCLAEEITSREDEQRQARVIITARQPVMLGPHIAGRHVGPLSRWSADEFARTLPRLRQLSGAQREYAWRLTAGHPRSLRALDERLTDIRFADLAEQMAGAIASRTGLSATRIFPTELDAAAVAAVASAADSVLDTPQLTAGAVAAPYSLVGPRDSKRRPRHTRLRIVSAALITAAVAWTPFAIRSLLAGSAGHPTSGRATAGRATANPAAANPAAANASHSASAAGGRGGGGERILQAAQSTQAVPEAAAASWLAGNVTSGTAIGCDPATCASLSHQGLARADLSPLRPGGDLTADGLIVATPQARALMGSAIEAAAPELEASFGTGSGQVDIWEVTPGGAAAYYSWRLAADMVSRREGGNLIMGNASIKTSGDAWVVLCGGHVDSRILLALAELAHSMPLTIVSFGAANPGAAPQAPVRSVLIDIADPVAAAASLKVQNPVMQPLAVRLGQASLWIEYGAPSPLGLFQAES